jgi:hypothetical protein
MFQGSSVRVINTDKIGDNIDITEITKEQEGPSEGFLDLNTLK